MTAPFAIYHLTLPFITLPNMLDVMFWKNPYTWEGPGGWTEHGNIKNFIIVAESPQRAREIAAEKDCPIWLDPEYATCLAVDAAQEGVLCQEGGQAENE